MLPRGLTHWTVRPKTVTQWYRPSHGNKAIADTVAPCIPLLPELFFPCSTGSLQRSSDIAAPRGAQTNTTNLSSRCTRSPTRSHAQRSTPWNAPCGLALALVPDAVVPRPQTAPPISESSSPPHPRGLPPVHALPPPGCQGSEDPNPNPKNRKVQESEERLPGEPTHRYP
jgi:hypothetical protein